MTVKWIGYLLVGVLLILLMSASQGKSFFKQYAKSSYMSKINPQFEGIAKRYYKQKKEHDKLHHIKNKLDQEVAYIQRMERNMQNNLQQKKRQLQFTKEVSSRVVSDMRRREWLNEFKTQSVKNNQQRAQFVKCDSQRKLKEAKIYLNEHKRSLATLNRNENAKIKEIKSLKKAQEWDLNKSRASQIYQFKLNLKESTNKFYRTRNASSMSNYQKRIQSYKKFEAYDNQRITQLEGMKQTLGSKYKQNKGEYDILNQEIQRVKRQGRMESSTVRSRLKQSRSQASLSARSDTSIKHIKSNSELVPLEH